MKRLNITIPMVALALSSLFVGPAFATDFEVKMLNKGEVGAMVFEPAFVAAEVGDTVTFFPTDKGHNVQSIKGMLPEGVEKFKSKVNKEFTLTLDVEGLYGIKCTPHFALGMVMMIQAGQASNLETFLAAKLKSRSKKRFAPLFEQIVTE